MRIAITSEGSELSNKVNRRFGRATWLIVADTETDEISASNNEVDPDAYIFGIQTAQNVFDLGVEAVVTGNIGPNAFTALNAWGVKVFLSQVDTVEEVLTSFKAGTLKQVNEANVPTHWAREVALKRKCS
jgi:predicted Fe-Mo cluster-binding NifX family protein